MKNFHIIFTNSGCLQFFFQIRKTSSPMDYLKVCRNEELTWPGKEPDKLLDRKTENTILSLGECCPGRK